MPDPTPEEIAEFKRAFKLKAEETNTRIRWEEPQGCLSFLKTQSTLAPVVESLDYLQADPSAERLQYVLEVIGGLSDYSDQKYTEALTTLTQSLMRALEDAQEEDPVVVDEEAPVDPAPIVHPLVEPVPEPEEQPETEPEEEPEILAGVDQVLAHVLPKDSITPQMRAEFNRFAVENELVTAEDIWREYHIHKDIEDEAAVQELAELYQLDDNSRRLDERMRTFAQEKGWVEDEAGYAIEYWKSEDFWLEWKRHTRFDIAFDDNTDEADQALEEARFDGDAEPATTVMDQLLASMPRWKHERNTVLDDGGKMSMSFEKSIKSSAVGGVEYWKGNIPGIEEQSYSMNNLKVIDLPEQDQAMVAVAKSAIDTIRGNLSKGPFNNYQGLPEEVIQAQRIPREILEHHEREELAGSPAPAWWNAVVEVAALKAKNQVSGNFPDTNEQKLQMACLARATQEIGGGVCSKMAMCTTGALTTSLPPGSEIVQLFHEFDHEFVIARVPGGNWFAVDPWPHEPTVLPFVDCQFDPSGVKNYVMTVVTETADHPFGIDLDVVNWQTTIAAAMRETKIDALEMQGVYGHTGNQSSGNFDPALKAGTGWG